LATGIAESCIAGGVGAHMGYALDAPLNAALFFGEIQSAVMISCAARDREAIYDLAPENFGLKVLILGTVGTDELSWGRAKLSVAELREAYESGLPRALGAATLNV
jgi:hypothetical protein